MTLTCSDNKTKLNSSQRNLEYSQDENYLTINYKKIKKKNIASVDLYFPFILFYLWILCESAAAKIEKCDAATQQSIFQNLPQCEPRTSLVDLRQFFVDNQDIIQVVPDHVMVHRCGGSCYMEAYDCIPTKTSVRTVEVMLVQSKWPHGQHEVHCSQLEVEVHDKCNCGCKLKKENCNKYQYYHEPSCRWVIKVIFNHHHQIFTNCLCSDVFVTIQKLDLLALLPIKFGIQIPANVIAQRIPFKLAQQVTCLISLAHAPACLIIIKEVLLLAGKALLLELSYFCSSQLLSLQLYSSCINRKLASSRDHQIQISILEGAQMRV